MGVCYVMLRCRITTVGFHCQNLCKAWFVSVFRHRLKRALRESLTRLLYDYFACAVFEIFEPQLAHIGD
jgi:hypothetical protein